MCQSDAIGLATVRGGTAAGRRTSFETDLGIRIDQDPISPELLQAVSGGSWISNIVNDVGHDGQNGAVIGGAIGAIGGALTGGLATGGIGAPAGFVLGGAEGAGAGGVVGALWGLGRGIKDEVFPHKTQKLTTLKKK